MNNSNRDISTDQAHVWAGSYSSTGAYIAMLVRIKDFNYNNIQVEY